MRRKVVFIPKNIFNKEELERSIEKGIIPRNAISWAAENGFVALTKVLIEKGAKVNENCNYPLELASKNGHTEIVKMLLDAGATTRDSEPDEGYCLRIAAYYSHVEIVKLLLNAGANPIANDYSALYLALKVQAMDIAEILLDAILEKRLQRE